MMRAPRDVSLNIGKGIYTVSTPLENEELDRLKAIINEACVEGGKGAKQEDLLMLACLRLAYSLDAVNGKLAGICASLEEAG